MGALSMLPGENKRVILGCKMVTKTLKVFILGWLLNIQLYSAPWSIKI